MRKVRIFCGPADTAGNASLVAFALRSIGVHADAILETPYPINYKYHRLEFYFKNSILRKFNIFLKIIYFMKYLIKYDIFIFNTLRSLLPYQKDLPILRFFKKKIVVIFGGCEARDPSSIFQFPNIFCKYCNTRNKEYFNCTESKINIKYHKVKYFEHYADYIFTFDDVAGFLEKDFYFKYHISPNPPKKDYVKKHLETGKIKIAHCATNKIHKRTDVVVKVMRKLERDYSASCEFTLLCNVNNEDVLTVLESVHILIDQFCGYYGLLAVEAMARGVIVIETIDDWLLKYRPDFPGISTDVDDLYETLVGLMISRQKRIDVVTRTLDYYRKYHSPKAVGKYYTTMLGIQ